MKLPELKRQTTNLFLIVVVNAGLSFVLQPTNKTLLLVSFFLCMPNSLINMDSGN